MGRNVTTRSVRRPVRCTLPQSTHITTIHATTMDEFDAFIDYGNAVDDHGEVTVSGVDPGNANNGRGSERTTRSIARAFAARLCHRQRQTRIALVPRSAAILLDM
jgi:hypothetical protein